MPKIALLFLVLACLTALGAPHPKVQDRVWAEVEHGEQILVVLAEQTDVRPFLKLERRGRGQGIVAAVREAAWRTQAPLRTLLTGRRARFTNCWAANVFVVHGNRPLLEL